MKETGKCAMTKLVMAHLPQWGDRAIAMTSFC